MGISVYPDTDHISGRRAPPLHPDEVAEAVEPLGSEVGIPDGEILAEETTASKPSACRMSPTSGANTGVSIR
jgi:hypothetical protein